MDETASPKGKSEVIVISHENMQDFYKLGKLLGSGGFATGNSIYLIITIFFSLKNVYSSLSNLEIQLKATLCRKIHKQG